MSKTFKREIEDFDDDELFNMEMELDDDLEDLFGPNDRLPTAKKNGRKNTDRRASISRSLPDDWQDFDYGNSSNGDYAESDWR